MTFPVRINCFPLPNHSEAFLDEFLRRPKPPGLALETRTQAIHARARYQRVHLNLNVKFWKTNWFFWGAGLRPCFSTHASNVSIWKILSARVRQLKTHRQVQRPLRSHLFYMNFDTAEAISKINVNYLRSETMFHKKLHICPDFQKCWLALPYGRITLLAYRRKLYESFWSSCSYGSGIQFPGIPYLPRAVNRQPGYRAGDS